MFKRFSSFFCVLLFCFAIFPLTVFAESHVFDEITKTISLESFDIPVSVSISPCSNKCGYSKYSWDFAGYKGSFVDADGLPLTTVYRHWLDWFHSIYGANSSPKKIVTTGGASGGRNPPSGYTSDGVPSVDSSGQLTWQPVWPEDLSGKFDAVDLRYLYTLRNFTRTNTDSPSIHVFQSGSRFRIVLSPALNRSSFTFRYVRSNNYKVTFIAPVSGWYTSRSLKWTDNSAEGSTPYLKASGLSAPQYWSIISNYFEKGEKIILPLNTIGATFYDSTSNAILSRYEDNIYTPIFTITPDELTTTKQTNITINNNVWNGNIYQDTTNNLTYIYPQYTTINDNGDTVTNISNNPIIYNNTTNEYYTYDSTTNNYYYITYVTAPDPTATPAPSTGPDPGPTPGGGSSGGSSSGGSTSTPESGSGSSGGGQSWWSKLLDKLGNGIVDLLLDAISTVFNLILKLFSTILGWIIWFASKSLDLLPFLPPGLNALLVGGVVVIFVIYIIKFIRG